MTLPDFALERPETLAEALQLLDQHGDQAALYMGGTELLLAMKYGLVDVSVLVDGKRVDELAEIETGDGWIRVGAGMTHLQVESEPAVRDFLPELCRLARTVANLRVRATGTLGGNLCFAEPHSDPATLLVALGARAQIQGKAGAKTVGIDKLIAGAYETSLAADEVLTGVEIPLTPKSRRATYLKFQLHERPTLGLALVLEVDGDNIVAATAVVGSVSPVPTQSDKANALLVGSRAQVEKQLSDAAESLAQVADPVDDLEGSAEYKRHLISVFLQRAFSRALS